MINLKIDNKSISVKDNITILEAAQLAGIKIPTLCYLKDINVIGSCRICLVSVKGLTKLVPACTTFVKEQMEVYTNTKEVIESRTKTLQLILSSHNKDCPNCTRNNKCELQDLFEEYHISEDVYKTSPNLCAIDNTTSSIVRDNSKCILCNRCVATCEKIQKISVIGKNNRGINTHIGCAFDKKLSDVPCITCGQCINACPTGALSEKDDTKEVFNAINNKDLYVVVATAPAVRVALGEEFGLPIGTMVKGKMVSALKQLQFDKVFDITFGADLTVMEETTEFIKRYKSKKNLPLITSCSPGWIKYLEYYYPELIKNVSSCKSPQQMCGATIKTYYAKKEKLDPKKIFFVSVVPCTAKKEEKNRINQSAAGIPDVDAVITTRELARMIKSKNIDFINLNEEEFDDPFGNGASVIFGSTGGVMESALRTVSEILTKKPLEKLDFTEVRGNIGIKECTYEINGKKINIAIINGISNAKSVLDEIKKGHSKYHFIEIMTCPGGCINGGGQPICNSQTKMSVDIIEKRSKALYQEDKNFEIRSASKNPDIMEIYNKFLIKPGSLKAHKILHTSYKPKPKYK